MGRQWIPIVFAATCVFAVASAAYGQGQGRIIGAVLDDDDDAPIPGALVRVENPAAARAFDATAGEDGRFTVFGLTSGTWTVHASAEGYTPTSATAPVMQSVGQVVTVRLKRIPSRLEMAIGAEALAGRDPAALERDLDAADRAFNEQRWDEALAGYTAILDEIPAFSDLLVQVGNTYRAQGDYEAALAAYDRLLAVEVKAAAPRYADTTGLRLFREEYGDQFAGGLLLHGGNEVLQMSEGILAAPWWRIL